MTERPTPAAPLDLDGAWLIWSIDHFGIGNVRELLIAELNAIDEKRARVQRLLEAFDAYEGGDA
jgi:hypothetical protein